MSNELKEKEKKLKNAEENYNKTKNNIEKNIEENKKEWREKDYKTMQKIRILISIHFILIIIFLGILWCIYTQNLDKYYSVFSIIISIIFAFVSLLITIFIYINSKEMNVHNNLSNNEFVKDIINLDHRLDKIEQKLDEILIKLKNN